MKTWLVYYGMVHLHIRWWRIDLENFDVEEQLANIQKVLITPQTVCIEGNVDRVYDFIKKNRRWTSKPLAEVSTDFSIGTIGTIINGYLELNGLTPEQKRGRVTTACANLKLFNSDQETFRELMEPGLITSITCRIFKAMNGDANDLHHHASFWSNSLRVRLSSPFSAIQRNAINWLAGTRTIEAQVNITLR